jgi:homopolymeric O-antigen transport system ATP-binding protein
MSNIAIHVENLSKQYRIGQHRRGNTLRDTLTERIYSPFRRLLQPINGQTAIEVQRSNNTIWALKGVSFEVKRGEVIGIIGRNGAGKSTLLKILTRITEPTEGFAGIYGSVGSLLEVGTGFHSELTGRENIYLNGAILGMKKAEIDRKFDEIVNFSEIEKFLDTPVKHYSSGMYVRLAFAVAAHLEPEILIVDEVLAVGDVQFQKKCLGKMQVMAQDQGRTVLFVSHNMDAIQRLCSHCVLLDSGQLIAQDKPSCIITRYLGSLGFIATPNNWVDISTVRRSGGGREARFMAAQYSSLNEALSFQPYSNGPLEFLLLIESRSSQSVGSLALSIRDQGGRPLVNADTDSIGHVIDLRKGENTVRLRIDRLYLNPGSYLVGLWLDKTGKSSGNEALDYIESAFEINVIRSKDETFGMHEGGPVVCQFEFLEVK